MTARHEDPFGTRAPEEQQTLSLLLLVAWELWQAWEPGNTRERTRVPGAQEEGWQKGGWQ